MGSLTDGINFNKGKPGAQGAAEPAKKNNPLKIAIAAVCLLAGAALIAWNMGVFGEPTPPAPPPAVANEGAEASNAAAAAQPVRTVQPSRELNNRPSIPAQPNELINLPTR